MITDMPGIVPFFNYAKERYKIKLRKEAGLSKPWTTDKVLQGYRFCNVHREDDTVTKWIRSHITFEEFTENLVGAMVIARWFNRIETLELMFPDLFLSWNFSLEEWEEKMIERLSNVSPLVTGAYMIKTPADMNKLNGLITCLKPVLRSSKELQRKFIELKSLEDSTELLASFDYLGPFMAYEVITDLRHTPVLNQAKDINLWANPGPGATRGLCRLLGVELNTFRRCKRQDVEQMMKLMQQILQFSKEEQFWPKFWPHWEMREVEHTLCEFDKYERVRLGEGRPKQKYKGEKE